MASVASVPSSSSPTIDYQDKVCAGCRGSVDDGDGVVVSFGDSLWHIDCFNCAKCGKRVSADTNILLLSDGSPMCSSCSYNCAVCKKPISNEAIMTGDESYHASCFACRNCRRHITELVFAKTSHGIYCMGCHNERVARSKKQRKQGIAKSREALAKDREKMKTREQNSIPFLKDNVNFVPETPPDTPHGQANLQNDATVNRSARRISTQIASLGHYKDLINNRASFYENKETSSASVPVPLSSPAIKTTHASPPPSISSRTHLERQLSDSGPSLQLPVSQTLSGTPRRRSFDDQRSRPILNGMDLGPSPRPSSSSGTVHTSRTASPRSLNQSQIHLSPTSEVNRYSFGPAGQTQMRHTTAERSRSPSPSLQQSGTKSPRTRSPIQEIATSSPPSPSLLTPQRPPIYRSASGTTVTSTADRAFSPRAHSLPDQNYRPLIQSPISLESGQITPGPPATPSGPSIFAQQQSQSLAVQRLKDEPPMRDLPQLPEEVDEDEGLHEDHFTTEEEDEGIEEEPNQRINLPMALPPISFGDGDTSFDDLLKLGSQSDEVKKEEKRTSASPPLPPSKAEDVTPVKKVTSPKRTNPIPLNLLPKRSTSLRRANSSRQLDTPRKIDPSALVLSETFDADMARDTDDSVTSSPDRGPGPLESLSNPPERPLRSPQRPGSAGVTGTAPSSPTGTRARSSSATALTPVVVDRLSPTTPIRSVSSPESLTTPAQTPGPHATTSSRKRNSVTDMVLKKVKEAFGEAQEYGVAMMKLDRESLEVIYAAILSGRSDSRGKFADEVITQEQFVNEVAARREAEAEVTRLKVQLSGQAARLTELSAGERKRDVAEQMSRDYSESLHGLERDVSKLKAERDLTAVEIEELAAAKKSQAPLEQSIQRSLTRRFEALKSQYKRELEPLVQQKERLFREINELNAERTICLEATTALTARNEELAALGAQMMRQLETGPRNGMRPAMQSQTTPKHNPLPPLPQNNINLLYMTPSTIVHEERDEPKGTPRGRIMPWNNKPSRQASDALHHHPEKENLRHNFQQTTVLRARCDHCGERLWGSQLRCTVCHVGLHNRCLATFNVVCAGEPRGREDTATPAPQHPSMFGRDLIEQVRADSVTHHRDIPIIVEKCIYAVEHRAMDYEGIYRKTGGSSESKAITSLFERGNCEAIDLCNCDLYIDISSVTSVLKTYFRMLPNPLLTYALHEAFVSAASIRDPLSKAQSLSSLVFQLPSEHFHTLRYLMLHLHRIQLRSAENLMTARNLGVVFGPTLMRSSDSSREFADMAGKALSIEWLVENAPSVFRDLGEN